MLGRRPLGVGPPRVQLKQHVVVGVAQRADTPPSPSPSRSGLVDRPPRYWARADALIADKIDKAITRRHDFGIESTYLELRERRVEVRPRDQLAGGLRARVTGDPTSPVSGRRRRAPRALASVRRSNGTYSFPAYRFHEDVLLNGPVVRDVSSCPTETTNKSSA